MNLKIIIYLVCTAAMIPFGQSNNCMKEGNGVQVGWDGGKCISIYYKTPRSRDGAMKFCKLQTPSLDLVPASNRSGHVAWFAQHISSDFLATDPELWTSLSFDVLDGDVHLPDHTILSKENYTWASGSRPSSSEPCLAAIAINSSLFTLLPKSCHKKLPFIHMGAPPDTCDCAHGTCFTKFTDSCSAECQPNPETTISTRTTTVTTTSTTSTISSTRGTSTTTPTTISSTNTITSTHGTVEDVETKTKVVIGSIIGGVIGGVVVLLLLIGLVIYLSKKNRASPPTMPLKNNLV